MPEKQSKQSGGVGGARVGAGRKKGQANRRTLEQQAVAQNAGITPLEYMLDVMHNSGDAKMRMIAAQAAAPYVHAKLASIEVSGEGGGPIDHNLTVKFIGA